MSGDDAVRDSEHAVDSGAGEGGATWVEPEWEPELLEWLADLYVDFVVANDPHRSGFRFPREGSQAEDEYYTARFMLGFDEVNGLRLWELVAQRMPISFAGNLGEGPLETWVGKFGEDHEEEVMALVRRYPFMREALSSVILEDFKKARLPLLSPLTYQWRPNPELLSQNPVPGRGSRQSPGSKKRREPRRRAPWQSQEP